MATPTVFIFNRRNPPRLIQPVYDENGLFKSQSTALKFDCALSETHTVKNEATSFPVESGLDISDHVRQEPDQLKITGFVTNSPIEYLSFATSASDRVQAAYDTLMRLAGRKNTKLVTDLDSFFKPVIIDVATTLRMWLNMLIVSLEIVREPDTGDAIEFVMELKSIKKVAVNQANVNYSDTARSGGSGGVDDQLTAKTESGSKATQKPAPRTDSFLKVAGSKGLNAAVTDMKNAILHGIGE
jgi:hypothetical protein